MTGTMTQTPSAAMRPRVVEALRSRVVRLPGGLLAWRFGIGVLGLAVVATGILLLALPGPGWVIIFIGLGVWATEFSWAGRLLAYARRQVASWTAWVRTKPRWLQGLIGLVGVAALALVAYAGYRLLL